jgi:hypothetical protein
MFDSMCINRAAKFDRNFSRLRSDAGAKPKYKSLQFVS